MNFAHPLLLAAGLGAIALPILIHILMRRRRRPTPWGAMRFLLEAYRRQRQRIRFEQWLLLAARCLIVLLAALAIARPMIPGADPLLGSRATTLYVLIDNSLTASRMLDSVRVGDTTAPGTALDAHRETAYDLLDRLDESRGDRGAIYALAAPAHGVLAPASSSVMTLGGGVARVGPADSPADLHGALAQIAADISQNRERDGRVVIAILSEFLGGSSPTDRPLPSMAELGLEAGRLVLAATPPAGEGSGNVAITALDPVRPLVLGDDDGSTTQVRLRAVRTNPGAPPGTRLPITLSARRGSSLTPVGEGTLSFADGAAEASTVLDLDPRVIADLRLTPSAPLVLEARLATGDPLTRDNARLAVIERREALEVGVVAPPRFGPRPGVGDYRPGDWVQAALDPQGLGDASPVRVRPIPPGAVDPSTLASLHAVVVAEPQGISREGWSALRRFADLGGLILLFPQPGQGAQVWIDDARSALGLAWELPREAVEVGASEVEEGASASEPTAGTAMSRPSTPAPLLSMIEGELPELLRPITVRRSLAPASLDAARAQVMLTLGDGTPIVVAAAPEAGASRGLIVFAGVALDLSWSDLPTKPLLVPLLQEIVRQGVASARASWVSIAGQTPVAAPGAVELRWSPPPETPEGASGVVPLNPSAVARQAIRHAGLWQGVDASGAGRGVVAVNPATDASDTTPRSREEIAAWLQTAGLGPPMWLEDEPLLAGDGSTASPAPTQDWPLLPMLLALALTLAVVEAIIARTFSHASRAPTSEAQPAT